MARLCSRFLLFLLMASMACSTASRKTGDYKIALTPARRGQHGIFVMNSDTTGGKLLTPDPGAQLRGASWSPDGKKIAFVESLGTSSVFHVLTWAAGQGSISTAAAPTMTSLTYSGTTTTTTRTVPEPSSFMLFGSGILGLASLLRRKLF